MPRRSTGCERCRRRKVRCDEKKPSCARCVHAGVLCPGYRPPAERDFRFKVHTVAKAEQIDEAESQKWIKLRWKHYVSSNPQPVHRSAIDQGKVHQVQLLSTFLEMYLPKRRNTSLISHFAYIAYLPQVDASSPLLQASIDTLCLAELGSTFHDGRCLHEARVCYVRALSMLAREIAKNQPKQIPKDHVLAAIMILAMCSLFGTFSLEKRTNTGWTAHVTGAQRYIEAAGSDCTSTPFGQLLYHGVRHHSLSLGLSSRKRVPFMNSNWQNFNTKLPTSDPYIALYDLALQIPGILERADSIVAGNRAVGEIESLCRDIHDLRALLIEWYQELDQDLGQDLYKVVHVRDLAFANVCLNRTFQTVFHFSSVQMCIRLQIYWISCLNLDFTLHSLLEKQHTADLDLSLGLVPMSPEAAAALRREMFVTATNFCRSIPYCCEPEAASPGRTGMFMLPFVHSYFEQLGHCNEAEWCKAVRDIVHSAPERIDRSFPDTKAKQDTMALPWEVKHSCRGPVCNFKVVCRAPAPLLLSGEHPHGDHALGDVHENMDNHDGDSQLEMTV